MLERLFSRLTRQGECWNWAGTRVAKGYGRIRVGARMLATHRLMYEQIHGVKLSAEQQVMHRCDNPACCNPGHLSLGTNTLNIADKVSKDRSGKKLSIKTVRSIKLLLAAGAKQSAIAKEFQVNQSQISRIASGERWAHVNVNEGAEGQQPSAH